MFGVEPPTSLILFFLARGRSAQLFARPKNADSRRAGFAYDRRVPVEFVPHDFEVPTLFEGPGFRLEPLGPEHNERDHQAWMSSIAHIRATPGFQDRGWPEPMSLEKNRQDLVDHADDFAARTGFTYSVLDGDAVIGCVYIYPDSGECDASVRSWVTASRSELDPVLWRAMSDWLETSWPFENVRYAARS